MPENQGISPTMLLGGAGAALQLGLGAYQMFSGDKESDRLRKLRRGYQTPEEIYEMYQMVQSHASSGLDPFTLQYMTSEADQAFTATNNVAKLLGADPNALGANFTQHVNQIMKIGDENHRANLDNFVRLVDAKNIVAANKAAEQKSREDMLKDDITAANMDKQAGVQNIGNAFNSFLGVLAADGTSDLFKTKEELEMTKTQIGKEIGKKLSKFKFGF